jgi:hypothetical protein
MVVLGKETGIRHFTAIEFATAHFNVAVSHHHIARVLLRQDPTNRPGTRQKKSE